MGFKKNVSTCLKKLPVLPNIHYGWKIYGPYCLEHKVKKVKFMSANLGKFYVQKEYSSKSVQIGKLLKKVDINPVSDNMFFYSIDCFKTLKASKQILHNFTVDYSTIVHSSFAELEEKLKVQEDAFSSESILLINALKSYLIRCQNSDIAAQYRKGLDAIESLFIRPAATFYEALQRILFFNQLLWQTSHKHNGLGRLDMLLIDLYLKDIESGRLTKDSAKSMLTDFFKALHKNYWFKSGMMLGDTGQIIILGGVNEQKNYICNELTSLFIEVSMDMKLPEPKVLLRCSSSMPEDLLILALKCISTGIGAPLLSNDDVVIPCLISYGYDEKSSFDYSASACWEPLITEGSSDLNNIKSINFALPLMRLLNQPSIRKYESIQEIFADYSSYLKAYLSEILFDLESLEFETDPLITLVSHSAIKKRKDITRGGAVYNNLGLTSVGIGTVVNSLININNLVYESGEYSLDELNNIRKNNFDGEEILLNRLKESFPCFGCDDDIVIKLTRQIMAVAEEELMRHTTKWGGKFKFGLSSPYYIEDARNTAADLDGRKDGEPFNVHISSNRAIPTTELFSFAMKLDYSGGRLNGNVIDFFVSPQAINENIQKYSYLIRKGFSGGIFQLQMNVVDSKTLIEARKNPELFPNLIVRVWGFSAYFKDLPEEYKELLINRALESERSA